jgi:hypothetical protein
MKEVVTFRWEGDVESESGVAIYEVGTPTCSLRLPNFQSAYTTYMAMREAYQKGYEDGVCSTKAAVQSALSKLL